MHVCLSLDPLALDEIPREPLRQSNTRHFSLARLMRTHGRLVFGSKAESSAFADYIKRSPNLPQDARTTWIATLTELAKKNRVQILSDATTPLGDVACLEDLQRGWPPSQLVALSAQACTRLGVPEDVGYSSRHPETPDLTYIDAIEAAPPIREAERVATGLILPKGTHRDDFWDDSVRPVARGARNATIIDRFLFKSMWAIQRGEPRTRRTWRPDEPEHVLWLLHRLDEDLAPGATVTLISQREPADETLETTCQFISDRLDTTRLREVTVFLADRDRRFPHDRHIRFDTGVAVSVPAGFDRFQVSRTRNEDGTKIDYDYSDDQIKALTAREQLVPNQLRPRKQTLNLVWH